MSRTYYSAAQGAEVTTSSTTVWSSGPSLTFTKVAGATYYVLFSGEVRHDTTADDVQYRLWDGTTALASGNWEPRDTVPAEYQPVGGFVRIVDGGSGGSITLDVQIKAEVAANTTLRNGRIIAIQHISGDQWVETTAATTAGTTALQTLTWTPASTADYIVFGCAKLGSTAGAQGTVTLVKSATTYCLQNFSPGDATSLLHFLLGAYYSGLTAVSQTVTLVGSGANQTAADRRLLALDITGETAGESTAQTTAVTTTGTTYVAGSTYSGFTAAASVEHLIFVGWTGQANTLSVSYKVRAVLDPSGSNTVLGEGIHEAVGTNFTLGNSYVGIHSLTAGSQTLRTEVAAAESGTITAGVNNTKFVIWQIAAAAAATAIPPYQASPMMHMLMR